MANKNKSLLILVGTAMALSLIAAYVVTSNTRQAKPTIEAADVLPPSLAADVDVIVTANEDAPEELIDQSSKTSASAPDDSLDHTDLPIDARGAARRMALTEIHQALAYLGDESLQLGQLSDEEIIELIKNLSEQELSVDTVAGFKRVVLQNSFCEGSMFPSSIAAPGYNSDVRYDIPAEESQLTKHYLEDVKNEVAANKLRLKKLCYEEHNLKRIDIKALEEKFSNPNSIFGLLVLSEERTFEQVQLLSPADLNEAQTLPLPIRTIVATQILRGDITEQRCEAAWPFLAQGDGPHIAAARAQYISYGCPKPPAIEDDDPTLLFELAASYGNRQHVVRHLHNVRQTRDAVAEVEVAAWRQFEYGLLRDFCYGVSNIQLLTSHFRRPTNELSPHLHQQMESRARELEAAYGARAREHLGCAN